MSPAATASERTLAMRPGHNAVAEAKQFGELSVSYCDAESREATLMAVVELAENVLKYGVRDATNAAGTLGIAVNDRQVRVRVTNTVGSAEDARRVQGMVSEIARAPSVTDLYRRRLRELFENPGLKRAQLGLLRIAFEGSFRLSCSYVHPTLEIVAERACERRL